MGAGDHEGGGSSGAARRERWILPALLVLLPVLVFANSLHGGYHLDDHYRVANNPELERVWPPYRHFLEPSTSATLPQLVQYRPMLPLTLSLDVALADALGLERPLVQHAGNLALHVAVVLLLFVLFGELVRHWSRERPGPRAARRLAFAAALIFAVHPIAGVPVNYVCGRDLTLMLLFATSALLAYARWRRLGGARRAGAALLLLALSLCSKTNAAVAPLVVVAFELSLARERVLAPRVWLRALPAAAVVGAFFAGTTLLLDFSDYDQLKIERPLLEYPATELWVHVAYYLRNAAWPFHMRALPQIEAVGALWDPRALAGLAVVLLSLGAAWRLRRRAPLAAFAIGSYWILFLPTSSVVPLRSFAADYRQVPSLAFLSLLVAVALRRALAPGARVVALSTAVAWFGAAAFVLNRDWRTEESFWARSVRLGGTALAHVNYAVSVRAHDPRLAEAHLLRALAMYPNHVYAHINLGLLYIDEGRREEGTRLLERAVALQPRWGFTHHWLAVGLGRQGLWAAAAEASLRATELDPGNATYREWAVHHLYTAARQAQLARDVERSLPLLERLHRLTPSHRDSLFLEGWALQTAGDDAGAVERYERYLAEGGEEVQARFNLAFALMRLERLEDAVVQFQRTLRDAPGYREAHLHLATCLAALGREAEAARERQVYERDGR